MGARDSFDYALMGVYIRFSEFRVAFSCVGVAVGCAKGCVDSRTHVCGAARRSLTPAPPAPTD